MYCTANQETETETTAKQRHREGGRSGVRVALHLKFGKVNNELLCSTEDSWITIQFYPSESESRESVWRKEGDTAPMRE